MTASESAAAAPRPARPATLAAERIELLDALRGLALLGILVANIRYWSGWVFLDEADAEALAGEATVGLVNFLHYLLISGKFYTLFSLLFGVSFALLLSRLEQRSEKPLAIYVRRILVLFAIGLVHLLLLFRDDILTLYALTGLALLLVRRWPDRWLLIGALVLLAVPVLAEAGLWLTGARIDTGLGPIAVGLYTYFGGIPASGFIEGAARGDVGNYLAYSLSRWPARLDDLILDWRFPKVLATMMLGLWAGRRIVGGTLWQDRRLFKRVLLWGLALGLPANAAVAVMAGLRLDSPAAAFWGTFAFSLGAVPLALGYAALFVLVWPKAKAWLSVLAAPGRMALTNYLMQSILGLVIFFGIGFGLVGKLSPIGFYGVALTIFASQVLFSKWWLARFGQGPMERLWRIGTYGRPGKKPALASSIGSS